MHTYIVVNILPRSTTSVDNVFSVMESGNLLIVCDWSEGREERLSSCIRWREEPISAFDASTNMLMLLMTLDMSGEDSLRLRNRLGGAKLEGRTACWSHLH
jgi:hypothetical protein